MTVMISFPYNDIYFIFFLFMFHLRTIIVAIIILALDMITKVLFYDKAIWVDTLLLSPHFNTGIARSIPIPMLVIVWVTLGVIAILSWLYYQKQITRWMYSLFVSGALWNLYDRVFLWWVRDFIDLGWFPVFNIADIAITLWAMAIVFTTLFPWKFWLKE